MDALTGKTAPAPEFKSQDQPGGQSAPGGPRA